MMVTATEICVLTAALLACLIVGSLHLKVNLWLYALSTLFIALATAAAALEHSETGLIVIAILIALLKSIAIPKFFSWAIDKLHVYRDLGAIIAPPLAMHAAILLFALSFILTKEIPSPAGPGYGWFGAAGGISLVFTGLLLMLTRRLAISQIFGFLVIENGIYVFALTQTKGMPLMVEMGILLDVLVGVMVSGLLLFKIQKSFEHIDVGQLTQLKEP
jgi:hydrogenase-4 component E